MRHLILLIYVHIGLAFSHAQTQARRPHDERGDTTVSNVLWTVFVIGLIAGVTFLIKMFVDDKTAVMRP